MPDRDLLVASGGEEHLRMWLDTNRVWSCFEDRDWCVIGGNVNYRVERGVRMRGVLLHWPGREVEREAY